MDVYQKEIRVRTRKDVEIVDITEEVEKAVEESGVRSGICTVFVPHATAAIILEEFEEGLVKDMENFVRKLFPKGKGYFHDLIDDNAHAHLASGLISQGKFYPVRNGRLERGTWQRTLLFELDGPRERRVVITVIGK